MARRKRATTQNLRVTDQKIRAPVANSDAESFVAELPSGSTTTFGQTIDLRTFRATAPTLSISDRSRIVDQALVLMDDNYVHLPLKEAMHSVDPVQRLKSLQHRLAHDDSTMTELAFHREMTEIFTSARDLHTLYILPEPYRGMVAFVPLMIEEFVEIGERRYLVTNISTGFSRPPLEEGVEVVAWNGIPIARAVEIQGNRFAGSNTEARRARGTTTLTVRPLSVALPPDEDFVIIEYMAADGQRREMRQDWLVVSAPVSPGELLPPSPRDADFRFAASMAYDLELHTASMMRKHLFARDAVTDERRIARGASKAIKKAKAEGAAVGLAGFVPVSVMEGRAVDTPSGTFAYIRIRDFQYDSKVLNAREIIQSMIDKFMELARQLPQEGLIIDVRGNGGGFVLAGERLLQLLTPRTIQPEPSQFINSSLNLEICRRHAFLSPWVKSIDQAVLTGASHSRGIPLTTPQEANDIGQIYHGPVVLITDALCYSTTDIFAAGFQDHHIGKIIGVHGNTGAGGANVWRHDLLQQLYPPNAKGSPYQPLPNGAGMTVSIRRTLRVLENSGTLVEDLGVVPDQTHDMTRADLMNGNVDLINQAAEALVVMPLRKLQVKSVDRTDGDVVVTIETLGLTGCDVFADGRAQGATELSDGESELTITGGAGAELELKGFDGNELVATRRIRPV